jgi:hypothetical protein
MGNDGTLRCESLDVLRLFSEIAYRDEEREIGILVPGVFEHPIELLLDVFPETVAPRLYDHAPPDILGVFG